MLHKTFYKLINESSFLTAPFTQSLKTLSLNTFLVKITLFWISAALTVELKQ